MQTKNCEAIANCATIYCIRFNFCLPLEDIFPPCDIHPKLKRLLDETYERVMDSNLSIKFVLSSQLQGSIKERLSFKDSLVDINGHSQFDYLLPEPGIYFWTIRHFLGLLPVQLLPPYADNTHFQWSDHGKACRIYFKISRKSRINTFQLDSNIARSVENLPLANYILLRYLMHLFRNVLKAKKDDAKAGKNGCYLSQYFYQAIFLRPFMPTSFQMDNNTDHNYFYLLWYMIIKWPFIEQKVDVVIKPVDLNSFNTRKSYYYYYKELSNSTFDNNNYHIDSNIYLKDIATQTDPIDDKLLSEFVNSVKLDLHHSATDLNQTLFDSTLQKESKSWNEIRKETNVTLKKIEEYIFDDYETFQKESFNQISSQVIGENTDCNLFKPITQSSPKDLESVALSESNKIIQKKCNKSNDSIKNLYKITEVNNNNNNESDTISEYDSKNKGPRNVVDKVSKMGWTYTPTVDKSSQKDRKSMEIDLNAEKSDKSFVNIEHSNEEIIDLVEQNISDDFLDPNLVKQNDKEKRGKRKRRLKNWRKRFFSFFHRLNLKDSFSVDSIKSKIKYRKMKCSF